MSRRGGRQNSEPEGRETEQRAGGLGDRRNKPSTYRTKLGQTVRNNTIACYQTVIKLLVINNGPGISYFVRIYFMNPVYNMCCVYLRCSLFIMYTCVFQCGNIL